MAAAGAELEKMIQAATLRMHQSDFYSRDLSEATIDLGSEASSFSFNATTTFARFRALHYLRKTTAAAGGVASTVLTPLDPLHLFDQYGIERNDVWYNAGVNIVLRSSTNIRYLLAGWYQLPIISPVGSFASWIADLVPHAIIFDACSLIFQMLAQQDQSRKFDELVKDQLMQVKMHGLDARGY
jgi:hypothetical protein